MSYVMQNPSRRVSYAGFVQSPQQKARRISDVGLFRVSPVQANNPCTATSNSEGETATMLHDVVNNPTSRYDGNKNRRRISRPADDGLMCSQQSVLSAMDRFVRAVNNMDSTVLVPCRLQDIDVQSDTTIQANRCPPSGLDNVDVYGFYTMLKEVKNELLWGPSVNATVPTLVPSSGRSSPNNSNTQLTKHVRQSSDDSLGSLGFPSDQETDSDIESVVTDRDSVEEQSSSAGSHLATAFRHHLLGLNTILHELADSADYLSTRYQEAIDTAL